MAKIIILQKFDSILIQLLLKMSTEQVAEQFDKLTVNSYAEIIPDIKDTESIGGSVNDYQQPVMAQDAAPYYYYQQPVMPQYTQCASYYNYDYYIQYYAGQYAAQYGDYYIKLYAEKYVKDYMETHMKELQQNLEKNLKFSADLYAKQYSDMYSMRFSNHYANLWYVRNKPFNNKR